jgi:hypothetical protein
MAPSGAGSAADAIVTERNPPLEWGPAVSHSNRRRRRSADGNKCSSSACAALADGCGSRCRRYCRRTRMTAGKPCLDLQRTPAYGVDRAVSSGRAASWQYPSNSRNIYTKKPYVEESARLKGPYREPVGVACGPAHDYFETAGGRTPRSAHCDVAGVAEHLLGEGTCRRGGSENRMILIGLDTQRTRRTGRTRVSFRPLETRWASRTDRTCRADLAVTSGDVVPGVMV